MLDTCFQLARAADAICSDPKNGAAERLDCRQKASMAQLECLERVFPGRSAGSVPPEMPPRTVSPEMPTVTGSPEVPAGSVSPETPIGTVAKGEPTSSQKTPPGTVPPETPTATVSPEMTTGTASPGVPARRVDIPAKPQDTNWIVSETTSPVDYSPLDHGGDPLNDQLAGCTKHSGHSMSWTAHRSPASHGRNMARISFQQSSSRLSDQRPTPRQATMDYVRRWKDSQLRQRCRRVSAVATRRRATENQRAR